MASACGMKRANDVSPTSCKRHCDYKPPQEFVDAFQISMSNGSEKNQINQQKGQAEANPAEAMNVDEPVPEPKNAVFTSMPGNSCNGPRYVSAPYIANKNCNACVNGASGHFSHTYFAP